MLTTRCRIIDSVGKPIPSSKALIWGNNAAWICTGCEELLGNRTGDTEHIVPCATKGCDAKYEIERGANKNGEKHLGRATGVRKLR